MMQLIPWKPWPVWANTTKYAKLRFAAYSDTRRPGRQPGEAAVLFILNPVVQDAWQLFLESLQLLFGRVGCGSSSEQGDEAQADSVHEKTP
jgi:hypothetical protein